MDEARRLLREKAGPLAVAAGRQTKGRGTRGRTWHDGAGNVMVTVAVPRSVPVTLSLVPLRVGTIVRSVLEDMGCAPTLKWPNDVLLDGGKLAGTLIEMENDFLMIGVGVNVRDAPTVPSEGDDRGRRAVSLAACGVTPEAAGLARDIATAIFEWAGRDEDATVVEDWSRYADWTTPLTLRDTDEAVQPLRLLPDGRLLVRDLASGTDRELVADYLL